MEKTLIILRGLPGAGKSTLTKKLESDHGVEAVVCCADDYFYYGKEKIPENYNWDGEKLFAAHKSSLQKCEDAIEEGKELIISDNTNIHLRDLKPYAEMAKESGYKIEVHSIVGMSAEESAKFNTHNVPLDVCVKILKKYNPCPNNLIRKDQTIEVTNVIHDYMGIRKGVFGNGKFNKKDKKKSKKI